MFDFLYCVNLEYVKTPIIQIGNGVFMFCKSLIEIDLKHVIEIGNKAFSYCSPLKRIEFGPTIQRIPFYAFKDCINIEEVAFNQISNIEYICFGAFKNCISLSSVSFPPFLDAILDHAFENTSLKELRIPTITRVYSHAFDNNRNILIINTVVYGHEFIMYMDSHKIFSTTLGKQNSTYTFPDEIDRVDALALNSNHVFNETIGAYENDLGIRTLIVPESVHEISIGGISGAYRLGSHFIENICYNGTDLQMSILYREGLQYFKMFLYNQMDLEMLDGAISVDLDGPFPYPKIYAPNMIINEPYMYGFQYVNEPCPETVTQPEKIISESNIIHKKIVVKKDQIKNSETASSNINSNTQSSNDPIISIENGNASNNDSKLSSREKITIAVCVSLLIVVIVLSVIYIFIREKTSTISDDSDVFEMAEETKQTGTAVTYDNPFFSAHGSLQDDPFASDFQNDDEQDQYFRDGGVEE